MRFASISDRLDGLGSDKWAVHMAGRRRAQAGEHLVFLSIGEPDLPPPAAVLDRAVESMRNGRTKYSPGQGEPAALRAVARHLTARSGMPVDSSQVIYTAGTQHGLYVTLTTLVEHGNDVLVPDPYYATYEGIVAATGAGFVPVTTLPEDGFHLRPDALEAAITPESRVLLLNTPSNPTGAVLSPDEIDAIGEVCIRHDLWIVCDEVYADITYDAPFCSPFDRPQLRDRSIAVASISKSHALPGFRAGWVACAPDVAHRITSVAEAMLFGSQPFLGDAMAVALDQDHPEVAAIKAVFADRAKVLVTALDGSPAVSVHMPEGGMFVMADIRPTGLTGEQFAWRLLDEHGVVVMPGESFGSRGGGHIRLALTVEADVMAGAAGHIRALAEELHAAR
ncbi:MAG: pyridoxal phosphate-dependent aminotransferase [Ilumatobacteraceae bacterium]